MKQNGYSPPRSGLCKKLKPLAIELGCQDNHARYVAARVGETLSESLRDGIGAKRDDRECAASLLHGSQRCGDSHDHVGLRIDEVARHSRQFVRRAYAHVHDEIPTFDEAKVRELAAEGLIG